MPNTKPPVHDKKIPGCRAGQDTRDKLTRLIKERKIKWSELARRAIDDEYSKHFGDEPAKRQPEPKRTRRKKE